MITKTFYIRPLCILAMIITVSFTQAQPTPSVPSNKPQTNVIPTPRGTVQLRSIPLFYAPQTKVNYVRTRTGLFSITDVLEFDGESYNKVNETTQYLDGLGRALQTVVRQITPGPDPKDLVSPVEYDAFGRQVVKYLPYVQSAGNNTNDGAFKMDPFHAQDNFYKNVYKDADGKLMYDGEQFLYSQTDFEASPLNRVNKSMSPGNSWTGQAKGVVQNYLVNTEIDDVRLWTIANDPLSLSNQAATNIPASTSSYGSGQLYKNVVIDENNSAVVEYKDKEGQVVLKKVQISETVATDFSGTDGWLCTYYVYDDLNQLRFVIPPGAVDIIKDVWSLTQTNVVNELCFRYEYDEKGRMKNKKVPGAGWTEMIYDNRDRLVYTRDANMRNNHQWMVTLYDDLNRPALTGMLVPCDLTREQLQPYVNNAVAGPVTIDGAAPPSIVPARTIATHQSGTTLYQATESITFVDGFDSGNEPLVAEITTESTSNFSTEVVVTDPRPPSVSFAALTMTYYDDYNELTGISFLQSYNNKLEVNGNLAPEPVLSSSEQSAVQTVGLVTGTKVRIIDDPSNLSSGKWLTTTMFYDSKGRVIQSQSDNAAGGKDISTVRYDFTGKVIANHLVHNNPKSVGTTTVKTLMNYDFAGRLLTINKTINDQQDKSMQIVSNSYDELGNLKSKELGKKRLEVGPLEKLDYNYNIRGWLKGINAAYSHPELASGTPSRWFGMELNYDYGSEKAGILDRNQLNGNISSVTWRSKGDGVQRGFGYTYDRANRIMSADFSERSAGGSAYVDNSAVNFDMVMSSGKTGFTGYDPNGNIKGMTQWGLKLNNSPVIDQLEYHYYPNSNKLSAVSEELPQIKHKLGDFTDNNTAGNDYGYDANGNMTIDRNKHINGTPAPTISSTDGAIIYNHLNLPWKISMKKDDNSTAKGYITYRYDATGTKLSKTVHEEGVSQDKVTDYISGMVYEQNILQFIPHEEGRTRLTNNAGVITPNYDYFIKDQLGNVRMVLTDELQMNQYPALSFEGNSGSTEANEQKLWEDRTGSEMDITTNRIQKPGFGTSGNNSMLVRRSTGVTSAVGAGKLLKVMSSDRIHTSVDYYSQCNNCNSSNANGLASLATSLLSVLTTSSGATALTKSNSSTIANAISNDPGAVNFFAPEYGPGATTQPPKAYLHVLLFDEQFKLDPNASYVQQIVSGSSTISKVGSNAVDVKKNGFAYIYFSNESEEFVYFDNFMLTHERGPLLEETHYYPFGLTMAGISSKAALSLDNKFKFNNGTELQNKEFSDGSGLELYDAMFRMQDPQLGRFWQIDPLAMASTSVTPFHYVNNNPILFNDPFGLDTVRVNGAGSHKIKVAQGDVLAWTIGKTTSYYTYDPANKNGVGGFVGGGMDEGSMESVTVTGRKSDNTSAWGLGVEWLTGSGPRNHNFRDGDSFTSMLQTHQHIDNTRNSISRGLANGSMDLNTKYSNNYGLGGISGVPKYIRDYSTLMTGGLTGNVAVTFLGSYGLQYEIVSVDEQSGTAQVQFYVSNSSTIASGLRPPVIGYTPAWNNTVGKTLNSVFSSGPLSRTTQSVQWTETIKWK